MKEKTPLFIIDSFALVSMFNGDRISNKLIKTLYEMKSAGKTFKAFTTVSSFQRALWQMNEDAKVSNIKDSLELLDVGVMDIKGFMIFDYKNKESVMKEIIGVAKIFSGDPNNIQVIDEEK